MENTKDLFELSLDMTARNHLKESAKWGRLIAISGFILLGVLFIISIIFIIETINTYSVYSKQEKSTEIAGMIMLFLIAAAFYFFPCYYLLKFSAKMKTALISDDIPTLNEAFKNLRLMLRFFGIVTIIFMGLLGLGFLIELTGN
ncbi:MAG TPA: hypothetical protein VGO58_03920 [Chitinophagaceae bacterium]|jgi:hypothetical protein|nr:hypothetical protein [Chitinophagaceae bacterium]